MYVKCFHVMLNQSIFNINPGGKPWPRSNLCRFKFLCFDLACEDISPSSFAHYAAERRDSTFWVK